MDRFERSSVSRAKNIAENRPYIKINKDQGNKEGASSVKSYIKGQEFLRDMDNKDASAARYAAMQKKLSKK